MVRPVLKCVGGGGLSHRHLAEACDCASAAPQRVIAMPGSMRCMGGETKHLLAFVKSAKAQLSSPFLPIGSAIWILAIGNQTTDALNGEEDPLVELGRIFTEGLLGNTDFKR